MKKDRIRTLAGVGCLIALTAAALAYANRYTDTEPSLVPRSSVSDDSGIIGLTCTLPQTKILKGGDGRFTLALDLAAKDIEPEKDKALQRVDMVMVLDRSGSMSGEKINYAKDAVRRLAELLTSGDRFALVSYADGVYRHSALSAMTFDGKKEALAAVDGIRAGGGTNLGGGLAQGISLLFESGDSSRKAKVVLISDGLANKGVTDPATLGSMAADAARKGLSITTVGVGNDFNEQLMTALADYGTGNYYYMENPTAFARVFEKEFTEGLRVAAESLEIRIPLKNGLRLLDAGGYPIRMEGETSVFGTADILSGRNRKIYLTFMAPADRENSYEIRDVRVTYRHKGEAFSTLLSEPLEIACVADKKAVFASFEKEEWESKVLQNDYNRLKEDVADDIRKGKKEEAMDKIRVYEEKQKVVNEVVQSPGVTRNLDSDLKGLRRTVRDTFAGEEAEVRQKQKKTAKTLQFEGYQGKRK